MNKRLIFLTAVFLLVLSSCSLAAESKPYILSGKMIVEENSQDEKCQFKFSFTNQSSKEVASFNLSFFLFDEDGNPASNISPKISVKISQQVQSGDILNSSFNLDPFLCEVPEVPYEVNFLYVTKIIFTDGSEWNDPFGIKAF